MPVRAVRGRKKQNRATIRSNRYHIDYAAVHTGFKVQAMKFFACSMATGMMIVATTVSANEPSATSPKDFRRLAFKYDGGRPSAQDPSMRTHDLRLEVMSGIVHVYASFGPLDANPIEWPAGKPRCVQDLVIGETVDGKLVPAIRFGTTDSGRGPVKDRPLLSLWANDGAVDHFGDFARPQTPCDFKATIDLHKRMATVWTSRRGDDRWFLLLDGAPVSPKVKAINMVRVNQYPGAPGVNDVVIQDKTWQEGEVIRPHPLAKKNHSVAQKDGFRFQSMRSTWRSEPGRHVTIVRDPPVWFGFPEVVRTKDQSLVVAHNDGRQHGGGGGLFVRRSNDLGRTWSDPVRVVASGINCPRLQVLRDGSLLLLADIHGAVGLTPLFRSEDGGRTWKKIGELDAAKAGGHAAIVPSRIHEMDDGSWLAVGSWYPGGKPWEGKEGEQLEMFRSSDRGATWKLHSVLQTYPEYGHSLSEASFLAHKDGRLVLFAREGRGDGFPGIKAYSSDGGKTWDVHELPFAITGRTHANYLPDGRVMLTFRSGIGRQALWAWLGDPLEAPQPSAASGVHFQDAHTVALKDGELHLDNDGRRGQFTQYFFRPPAETCALDLTWEAKVVENQGRAATVSVPYAGKIRMFPDRIEVRTVRGTDHDSIAVSPGEFHSYRVSFRDSKLRLWIDGNEKYSTDRLDQSAIVQAWTPSRASVYGLAFGNERKKDWGNHDKADVHPDVWEPNISPEVTGYSVWRRFEAVVAEPRRPQRQIAWTGRANRFPDQYQLDHIVEIEASVAGHDQGYSGWATLPDGRNFVVNYTDDTARPVKPGAGGAAARMGVSWLRGTYLRSSDLPP